MLNVYSKGGDSSLNFCKLEAYTKAMQRYMSSWIMMMHSDMHSLPCSTCLVYDAYVNAEVLGLVCHPQQAAMPQPTPRECIKGPGQQGGVELNLVLVQALACKVYIMNNRLQSLPMQGRDAQHKHRV